MDVWTDVWTSRPLAGWSCYGGAMMRSASFQAFLRALADGASLQDAAASALLRRPRGGTTQAPELLERVRALGLGVETSTRAVLAALGLSGRADEMRVAYALRSLGYRRERMRSGRPSRGYVYRRAGGPGGA